MADGIRVKMVGIEKLKGKIKRVVPEIELALRKDFFDAAVEIKNDITAAVNAPKSGMIYRAKSGQKWQASAPGEAPARRTGKMLTRVKTVKSYRKFKPGAQVKYPEIFFLLERGMKPPHPVKPRPLIQPIMKKRRDAIRRTVEATSSRVMNAVIVRK